jgi:uncharacterized protein (DUF427 family)
MLYESGFAPRWYVPRAEIAAEALRAVEGQRFCPFEGLASYYDIDDAQNAAWSYRAPFEEVARIADLVSFYPDNVTIRIARQNVISRGPDRNLTVDEIGDIHLGEDPAATEA